MKEACYVIVNPNSGRRKGAKDWDIIKQCFKQAKLEFDFSFTKGRGDATKLALEAIQKGYRTIVVAGGDGTLNEAVNGILTQTTIPSDQVKIGMIPIGTGNDWGRMYSIPTDYVKAVDLIYKGNTFLQDAGKVHYHSRDGIKERFFVNMAGMGYDALVAKKTNIMKEKGGGGPFAYLINLFLGLIQYKFTALELKIDGQRAFEGKIFSMSVGICKYNGGGMMQLPFAQPDNGLFDITLIKKANKLKVITNIKNLYDGSFVKIPEVETFTGKKIELISKPPHAIFLETDGESLGFSPLKFEIIPKSVRLICG